MVDTHNTPSMSSEDLDKIDDIIDHLFGHLNSVFWSPTGIQSVCYFRNHITCINAGKSNTINVIESNNDPAHIELNP